MKQPIPFEKLADWIEGRLPAEEADEIGRLAAAAGAATRDDIAWLQAIQKLGERIVLPALPSPVRLSLAGSFEAYAQKRRQVPFWQRLVATLSFDSNKHFALAGVRAATGPAMSGQLLYSTEALDIALDLQPQPPGDQVRIMGQLFPLQEDAAATYSVQLLRHSALPHQPTIEQGITGTDDLGEFVFESVAPDVYDIVLCSDQLEVIIAPVDLRP